MIGAMTPSLISEKRFRTDGRGSLGADRAVQKPDGERVAVAMVGGRDVSSFEPAKAPATPASVPHGGTAESVALTLSAAPILSAGRVASALQGEVAPGTAALEAWLQRQERVSLNVIFGNIGPTGAITASPDPSSFYRDFQWRRDSSITGSEFFRAALAAPTGERGAYLGTTQRMLGFREHEQKVTRPTPENYERLRLLAEAFAKQPGIKPRWVRQGTGWRPLAGAAEPRIHLNGDPDYNHWSSGQSDGASLGWFSQDAMQRALAELAPGDVDSQSRVQALKDADLHYLLGVAEQDDPKVLEDVERWEEERGLHHASLYLMRAVFERAAAQHTAAGDSELAGRLSAEARELTAELEAFWTSDPEGDFLRATLNRDPEERKETKLSARDSAVVLSAVEVADSFSIGDRILGTAVRLEDDFASYPINKVTSDREGAPIAPAIGRYGTDVYPVELGGGNPWHLTTSGFGELAFWVAKDIVTKGRHVSESSASYYERAVGSDAGTFEVGQVLSAETDEGWRAALSLLVRGDAFLRRQSLYVSNGAVDGTGEGKGSMPEQFSKRDGSPVQAADMPWTHAALLRALRRRNELVAAAEHALATMGPERRARIQRIWNEVVQSKG